ncbi:hypothetical protein MMC22_003671 [Lobaria immixta]|nr:hypothetical protein [Lobaria immixta]
MSIYIIKTLAIARTLVGVSLLAVPLLTSRTFFLPASMSSTLALRLCGARDAALGGLLWSASSRLSSSDAQLPALLRPALMTGAVVDALDLVSVGACLVDGSVNVVPAAVVGGGAAVFLAAGVWGLRGAKFGGHGYTQVQ